MKELGQKILRNIDMVICVTRILIINKEKYTLREKYHEEPLIGGHYDQKRLVNKYSFKKVYFF